MAVTPNAVVTAQAIRPVNAVTVAAKTTMSDNTNAVKLCDAGANGSILYGLKAVPRLAGAASVTATQLQLFRSPDNGATMYLIDSVLMGAYTMAATTAVPQTPFQYTETSPLRVAAGQSIWVGQGVALASGIAWDGQIEDL